MCKLKSFHNYAVIPENVVSESGVVLKVAEVN